MKKYILALILGFGIVLQGQAVYAQMEDTTADSSINTQTFDKNILADEELMKTITPEQLEEYIAKGADVNARSGKYGWTPLIWAVVGENSKIIPTLINHGAYTEIRDKIGNTALIYSLWPIISSKKPNLEVIKTLLQNGANVNITNTFGRVVWTLAASWDFLDDNEELRTETYYKVKKELRPTGNDMLTAKEANYGVTPLQIALTNPNPEVIETLLKAGANVKTKTITGNSLLLTAVGQGKDVAISKKIIEMLLDYGAVPNDEELVFFIKARGSDEDVNELQNRIYNEWQKQNRIKAKEDFSKK